MHNLLSYHNLPDANIGSWLYLTISEIPHCTRPEEAYSLLNRLQTSLIGSGFVEQPTILQYWFFKQKSSFIGRPVKQTPSSRGALSLRETGDSYLVFGLSPPQETSRLM